MDLNSYFKIKEKGSSVRTEIMAGLTTFMTMAYILAVNPTILSATGMDASSVFAATAISSAISTLVMALYANLPIGLAPGMGINAFFAYSVCLGMGYSWQFGLTVVLIEGFIFIFLTVTNLRESILNCIPLPLKHAISAGIGLFIAFIGLQSSGIVVANPATLVSMGDIASPKAFVTVIGLAAIAIMLVRGVRGALLYGIFFATIVGVFNGVTQLGDLSFSSLISLPSVAPTFWQFDFSQIFTTDMLIILSTLLFVDLFDTVGTLVGVATKGNLLDENGKLPQAKQAFFADAIGSVVAAIFGTSAVTSYVESAGGVAAGGRTGLTALTIACLFTVSLLLAPIFLIIPAAATASTLIIVGLFMVTSLKEVDFDDYALGIPMFVTILGIPLTYSIANGIAWGIISYVVIYLLVGRIKEVHPLATILAVLFIAKYVFAL